MMVEHTPEQIVTFVWKEDCPICRPFIMGQIDRAGAVQAHKENGLGYWLSPLYQNGKKIGEEPRAHKDGYQGRYVPPEEKL